MSYCEICGCKIQGNSQKIMIEGTALIVCQNCANVKASYSIHKQKNEKIFKRTLNKKVEPVIKKTELDKNKYDIVEDYSIRIKSKREELGLTIEVLAKQVNEKESVIRKLESGKLRPDIYLAKKLEKALKIVLLAPQEQIASELWNEGFHNNQNITLGDVVELRKRSERRWIS